MKKEINEEIIEIIKNELNLKERILLKIFPKIFVKIYNISSVNCFNQIYKK